MSHKCIVPYPSKQISNSNKVTKVDKTRFDKLIKAKNARVKLCGTYFHQSQCENILNQFVEGFAYHREYYNQFRRAINDLKKREESSSLELSSISSSSSAVGSSGSSVAQPKRCHEKDSAATA